MVIKALEKKMWRDLWSLKSQVLTVAVLIICGISLLVSEWSAYRSLQNARDHYYKHYCFADIFADFQTASIEPIRRIESLPGIETVVARITATGLVNLNGREEPSVGEFIAIPSAQQPRLNKIFLRYGRLPKDSNELEIVVHEGYASANHLKPGDQINIVLKGKSEFARIVGIGLSPEYVYAINSSTPLPDDLHFGIFWMTEKSMQRMLNFNGSFNNIIVTIKPGSTSMPEIQANIDLILKPYGSLGAYNRDRQISNMFVEDEISQQKISSIFIPAIFLAIASFIVNIIVSRLVSRHRMQIAALKALGYTRSEISIHYLKLVFYMALTGTIPGILLGALLGRWMSALYESYFRFPSLHFSISKSAAFIGLIAGILPGLAGAASSIRNVFAMAPAEAMRPVSPPAFHATLIDVLQLQRFIRPTGLMIFRNFLNRPLRLLSIILSLSAALAIVITAGSWSDMIAYLLKTQFNRAQKEDISVTLARPHPSNMIQELRHLPGVIFAEGYRELPIRMQFQHHKREISLIGWPEKREMRALLNKDLTPISMPASGILLSKFFQKSWGIKAGDNVLITALEGSSKFIEMPVAGFTDELFGIGAHINLPNLWAFMNEAPGYNIVTIKADMTKIKELYIALKGRPEVISIQIKNTLYKGFNESFGKVINSMTAILSIAALLIAVGIIYNSIRVSFSERSWELASLRVLGLQRIEVSTILLFEVGIQVLISLMPGCFLGRWLTELSMKLIHTETLAFPVVIEVSTYARGILVVLLAFALSSLIVYKMSGQLNPAEALKARE